MTSKIGTKLKTNSKIPRAVTKVIIPKEEEMR